MITIGLDLASTGRRKNPSVVGAFAYPGQCLNLTDYGVMNELALAYEATKGISEAAGTALPENSVQQKTGAWLS